MPGLVRRFGLCLALVVAVCAGMTVAGGPVSAQTSCDPAYPDFCIPPTWEVGILDCAAIGATDFTVYDPDPHGFDPDYDGLGCNTGVMGEASGAAAGEAAPADASGCDPSYPEVCLPSSPDYDCADVGFALTVLHDPSIGAYDPHGLDEDVDGIGCETW